MEDLKEVLQTDAEDDDGLSEPKNYDEVFKERKHMGLCWKKYPSPKLYGKKIITNDVGGGVPLRFSKLRGNGKQKWVLDQSKIQLSFLLS